ncbi:MAG: hydrolase [Oscillospiraceae bacterium]|nr:hydrolase [Oscillospiraceae bacterium]
MRKKKTMAFLLALALLFTAAACGSGNGETTGGQTNGPPPTEQMNPPEEDAGDAAEPVIEPPAPEPEPYQISDPKVMPEGGQKDGVTYAAWNDLVEHLFFHPIIAYPELAFDGDAQEQGLDDYMVTVDEFNRILDSVYERGYVLVDINDVWSETTDADGNPVMVKNTLYLPEGKKPLVLSYDDTNYYPYMLDNGLTYKLIIGDDGKIWSWGLDPGGNEVVSRDLDAIPALDKFVEEHPDFSPFGAKACLSLTGYEGILGYHTQTDTQSWTDAQEAERQKEREAVRPVIEELKRTGWTFGSHTWGHIRLGSGNMEKIQADTQRWLDEVGSLVGPTTILFYPHGERPDGNDWKNTGPTFQYLQEQGFRVFCSVGTQSFSYIKKDICAVICDRLHPDGKTLRWSRNRYLQFYDAKDIMDMTVRPDYGVGTDWDTTGN